MKKKYGCNSVDFNKKKIVGQKVCGRIYQKNYILQYTQR